MQAEPGDFDSFNQAANDIVFTQFNAGTGIPSVFEQEIAAEIEINT